MHDPDWIGGDTLSMAAVSDQLIIENVSVVFSRPKWRLRLVVTVVVVACLDFTPRRLNVLVSVLANLDSERVHHFHASRRRLFELVLRPPGQKASARERKPKHENMTLARVVEMIAERFRIV